MSFMKKCKEHKERMMQTIERSNLLQKLSVLFVLLMTFFLVSCGNKLPIETNMNETVADFQFTTQDNESLALEDLEGTWWIADFIFTNCTTVCLPMTSNMASLQEQLEQQQIPIQLISFSVDPEYDTPDVLKEYGESYGASFKNWTFLTGYEFQEVKELSIKSFRAPLKAPEPGSDQFLHDSRFFLVDPEGNIVKGYDGVQPSGLEEIISDLQTLQQEGLL